MDIEPSTISRRLNVLAALRLYKNGTFSALPHTLLKTVASPEAVSWYSVI